MIAANNNRNGSKVPYGYCDVKTSDMYFDAVG